ncbi:MAG TPA: hypothetical protein DCM40_27135 [Maribacter sp.]|nr:hypothetical protein [Maribacter sp.]
MMKRITVRLDTESIESIKQVCQENDTSLSKVVRAALYDYLAGIGLSTGKEVSNVLSCEAV